MGNQTLIPSAQDDGLYCGEAVGSWVEDKHRLVAYYESLFSTGMKNKWDARVYVDLYAGAGLLKVRDSQKFLWGSPILALSVEEPFDKYIFCESNAESMAALKSRVTKHFPQADVDFVEGSCDGKLDEILDRIPKPSKNFHVLSFCFVDPYDLSIKFSTVRKIADRFVDFLFLLALYMDANRNQSHYLDTSNRKIDEFLGLPDWREKWIASKGLSFPRFLAEAYAKQMETLGYLATGFEAMKQVRSDVNNLPLYHLALFSRHKRAYEFWKHVLKYTTPQKSFWD
jgi:three-Cys-motif partner protein